MLNSIFNTINICYRFLSKIKNKTREIKLDVVRNIIYIIFINKVVAIFTVRISKNQVYLVKLRSTEHPQV